MVKSGMGLNKIELNFKGFKNIITLIVGNNGTGKTGGILSNLHPYAGLGHLEARDDSDIIIKGKDGHKVIIFKSKKHEYYIEHHYKWQGEKRSRKISSYLKKDGKELNPSGSVTQFNLLIETEFQIDLNFLKLMRLGPNVRNFISLGATERKSFIAKLLAEVEAYIRDQKYANERSTMLSNDLKMAVDKKKRLNIEDITTLHDYMEGAQKRLEYYRNQKEKEIKDFFTYKGSIETDKFEQCEEELKSLKKE
jgi:recombinational DNA repair ATPase RecF